MYLHLHKLFKVLRYEAIVRQLLIFVSVCPRYDTKLHLVVRLLFLNAEVCDVLLDCHDSQVYSDLE